MRPQERQWYLGTNEASPEFRVIVLALMLVLGGVTSRPSQAAFQRIGDDANDCVYNGVPFGFPDYVTFPDIGSTWWVESGPLGFVTTRTIDLTGYTAQTIHILQHSSFAAVLSDGAVVGHIRVHYADGSSSDALDLIVGVNTAEWAYDRPEIQVYQHHTKIPAAFSFWTNLDSSSYYWGHFFYCSIECAQKALSSLELVLDPRAYDNTYGNGTWYGIFIDAITLDSPAPTVAIQFEYDDTIFISNPISQSRSFRMDALATPPGGSFKWEIIRGGDKIKVLSATEGDLATYIEIQGIAPSDPGQMYGDVGIKVTYTVGSEVAEDSKCISVVKPSALSVRNVVGPMPYEAGYEVDYYFQVVDQLGNPLRHRVNWEEKRKKVSSSLKGPVDLIKYFTGLKSGGGPTNADGTFCDMLAVNISLPVGYFMKVEQKNWVEGWDVGTRYQWFFRTYAESVEAAP